MIATPAKDKDLRSAIEIKCSECYGALAMANALGGSRSEDWNLCHAFKLADLVAESRKRQLDMAAWQCAVMGGILCDSKPYLAAIAKIHSLEQHGATLTDSGWYLDGVYLADTVAGALEAAGFTS